MRALVVAFAQQYSEKEQAQKMEAEDSAVSAKCQFDFWIGIGSDLSMGEVDIVVENPVLRENSRQQKIRHQGFEPRTN